MLKFEYPIVEHTTDTKVTMKIETYENYDQYKIWLKLSQNILGHY